MDTEEYEKEVIRLLLDYKTYACLNDNPVFHIQKKIKELLKHAVQDKIIDNDTQSYLTN